MPLHPVPFSPPESQTLFQHLLVSGVKPDVLARLWDTVVSPSLEDLNAELPAWLKRIENWGDPWVDPAVFSQPWDLTWDLGGSPLNLPVASVDESQKQQLWVEHLLIRMLRMGLSPLLPMPAPRKSSPPALLEWVNDRVLPLAVQECLRILGPIQTLPLLHGREEERSSSPSGRISYALSQGSPALAQVWKDAGADPFAVDDDGRSCVFYASNVASLDWALTVGLSLSVPDKKGRLPYETWEERAACGDLEDDDWGSMQKHVQAWLERTEESVDHLGLVLERTCRELNERHLGSAWKNHPLPGRLPCGRTALAVVCLGTLGKNEHSDQKYMLSRANKMISFLVSRVDLDVVSEPSDGLSDLAIISLVLDHHASFLKLANTTTIRTFKKQARSLPALPSPTAAVAWAYGGELPTSSAHAIMRWAVDQTLSADIDAEAKAIQQKQVSIGNVVETLPFARLWTEQVQKLLDTSGESGLVLENHIGWAGSLEKKMIQRACWWVRELASKVNQFPEAETVWADVALSAAERLMANNSFLLDENEPLKEFVATCDFEYHHSESQALAAALGCCMTLSESTACLRMPRFWERLVALSTPHLPVHDGLRAWFRAREMAMELPPAASVETAKPRF